MGFFLLKLSAFPIKRGFLLYDNIFLTPQTTDTKGFGKVVDYFELSKLSSIEKHKKDQLCLARYSFSQGMLLSRRQIT